MSAPKINKEEIRQFLQTVGPETKIYMGCDSERFKLKGVWYADYMLAIVVHIDGSKGARVFGEVQRAKDFDQKIDRPFNRMMSEAYRVAELFLDMQDVFAEFMIEPEIHLDINPNENYGSSCAVQAAVGYIRGVCNVVPFIKPDAFAASYAADQLKKITGAHA